MKAHIIKNKKTAESEKNKNTEKPFESDEEFWKALDDIAAKKQDFETTRQFINVLKKGYIEECSILIVGIEDVNGKDTVNQACIWNGENKVMLYLTDEKYCNGEYKFFPVTIAQRPHCVKAYICDVINNALEKEEVSAIVFNHGSEHEVVIPKFILSLCFEKLYKLMKSDE